MVGMEFTENDEGKPVLDSDGHELGVVDEVRHGTAYVTPMADLASPVRAELGWGGDDRDTYRLDEARIETVRSGEIELREP
jgi:hypothetical protein